MTREKGIVKWFSTEKGYGFIRRESGDEIFVHHTDIDVDGYASLRNGETVEFDVYQSDRGPKARNLVPLDSETSEPASGKAAAGSSGPARDRAGASGKRGGGRNASRDRLSRYDSSRDGTDAKKPLAEQIRARLGKRFPGFGG